MRSRALPTSHVRTFERTTPIAARFALGAISFLFAVGLTETASAGPKKALGDYSQICQDEHLSCLNDCQKRAGDFSWSNADLMTCFGVCDDWLDNACDPVFPKALVKNPGSVKPPLGGVITPGTTVPVFRVPKVPPTGGIAQ